MTFNFFKHNNSDMIGALASGLCLIHCLATPFIFIAQASSAQHVDAPVWWGTIDILFIIISFFAVLRSVSKSSKMWMKYALWVNWIGLCSIIFNEKLGLIHIPEESIYMPTIGLIILHIYNLYVCKCQEESCCTT